MITLATCSSGNSSNKSNKVARVSVSQLETILGQEGYTVVDTREPGIFAAGHIPGSVSVPLDMIRRWASTLPSATHVILYCD